MSISLRLRYGLLIAAPVAIDISAIAWSDNKTANNNYRLNKQDSVPSRKHHSTDTRVEKRCDKDADRELRSFDEAMENVNEQLADVDWGNIGDQVEAALNEANEEMIELRLDPEIIQKQIDESIENLHMEKINREIGRTVQQAMENIDFKEIESEINQSVHDALDKASEEIEKD
jgi:hypothetical protein